jgi:hypothetical protein
MGLGTSSRCADRRITVFPAAHKESVTSSWIPRIARQRRWHTTLTMEAPRRKLTLVARMSALPRGQRNLVATPPGLLHALLGINTFAQLDGHPKSGAS